MDAIEVGTESDVVDVDAISVADRKGCISSFDCGGGGGSGGALAAGLFCILVWNVIFPIV